MAFGFVVLHYKLAFATLLLTTITISIWYLAIFPILYWKKRGVKTTMFYWLKCAFELGTNAKFQGDVSKEMYEKFKALGAKYGGGSLFNVPALFVLDLTAVKNILVTDFNHFTDHVHPNQSNKMDFSGGIFFAKGDDWRNIRTKISPAFTPGQIKSTIPVILQQYKKLPGLLDQAVQNGGWFIFLDSVRVISMHGCFRCHQHQTGVRKLHNRRKRNQRLWGRLQHDGWR